MERLFYCLIFLFVIPKDRERFQHLDCFFILAFPFIRAFWLRRTTFLYAHEKTRIKNYYKNIPCNPFQSNRFLLWSASSWVKLSESKTGVGPI